jgi:crotonobetainyl-CoA:carnitine CoA-transferase CaiB-like acyl-CoA transferase
MWALLEASDVFVSSQRPSALARLGLDRSTFSRTRWLNIVGDRAEPEVPGHDLTYQARAGLLRDSLPASLFADVMGSERAFAVALLLLRQPRGAFAEVGLYDSLAPLVATSTFGLTAPGGPLAGGLPAYGVYRTRQGSIAIAALEPHFRERLYEALDLADGAPLDEAMRARSAEEWEGWARERGLPIARLRSITQID